MVLDRTKVQLSLPIEWLCLVGLDKGVIWVLQNIKSKTFTVIVEVVSSLQVKHLLNLEFNFFDSHFTLGVVDDDVCMCNLVAIENVLVELDMQGSFTLLASTVSGDFSFPFASATWNEFNWGFLHKNHAFVFHLVAAVVAQVGNHFVGHFCFAVEMTLFLVEVHGSWKTKWEHELEADRIVTRLETSFWEDKHRLLKIDEFLLRMILSRVIIMSFFPFDLLTPLDLETEVLGIVRLGTSYINFT